MFSLDDLQKMSEINGYNKKDLIQISNVRIDPSLPVSERVESYLSQIKNPYHFLHNDLVVHLKFDEDGADLKSQVMNYFQSLRKV